MLVGLCVDVIGRSYMLITSGSQRVKQENDEITKQTLITQLEQILLDTKPLL